MKNHTRQAEYLTKRLVARQSRMAFKEKAENAMKLIGHIIVAEAGWIVRKTEDGQTIRLKKIETSPPPSRKPALD